MITRPRIIYVVPLGENDTEHLVVVAESIRDQFALNVEVLAAMEAPVFAFDEVRQQFNSNLILKKLQAICPPDGLKILGLASFDLFSPIFSFVFGEAQFRGKCAVVSSYRLRGDPEGHRLHGCPPLTSRLEKEVMHELGHTFGLRHCVDPDCVMHYSSGVQCADRKFPFFCSACRDLMMWHLAANVFLKT